VAGKTLMTCTRLSVVSDLLTAQSFSGGVCVVVRNRVAVEGIQ